MSGYVPCGCPYCFEIAIGEPGDLCWECEEAGCDCEGECQVEHLTDEEGEAEEA